MNTVVWYLGSPLRLVRAIRLARQVRRHHAGGPPPDGYLAVAVQRDYLLSVAHGFHKYGDHGRENDVLDVGRAWSARVLEAIETRDEDALRESSTRALDEVERILVAAFSEERLA